MYEQIARNKRRAVIYVFIFFVIWVGIGAAIGAIFYPAHVNRFGNEVPANPGAIVAGMVIAALFAAGATLFSVSAGDKLVLAVSGARPADPTQYAQLHNIVEGLAIGDGMPKPAVYVINDPSPNAFATGISPKRAAVTATTGLLEMMNREEVEGVIGHEMSHIKNYDVRLLLIVSTLIGLAGLIASVIWRSMFYMRWGGGGRDRDGGNAFIVVIVAALLLSIVGFIIGPLIRLAISRRREELADVSGVALTRNPAGLISALKKLQQNDKPFARFNHATAAMCIDDPLQHHQSWFHHLFDTHPPLEERIAILERIEQGRA
jgi:heat shock protein HtpX